MRTKHPQQYMEAVKQGAHIADARTLTRDELPFEFMMNALRLNEGVRVCVVCRTYRAAAGGVYGRTGEGARAGLVGCPTRLGSSRRCRGSVF